MKIVIAGAGEVGFHLIENLSRENLNIAVIDINAEVLNKLKSDYDVLTDNTNIVDSKYLTKTYLSDTDLFLAITNSDETNMIACKLASEAGVKKTMCRIRQIDLSTANKEFSLDSLGIDWVINPVSLVADELSRLVLTPNIVDSHQFLNGDITLVGYKMTEYSRIIGKTIRKLEKECRGHSIQIGIIQRKSISTVPQKDETIRYEDVVYFICPTDEHTALRKIIGYERHQNKTKRIFINGGGHIGLRLAKILEKANQDVKVVEKDISRSFHIAEKLQKSLVLNFDGTDLIQLAAEGIENADYYISVTDSEQINLTSCLMACEQGVEHTICLVKQPELVQIINQNTPIAIGISPRVLTARYLVRFIQGTNVSSYFSLIDGQIEILEVHLDDKTSCLGTPLKKIELPENVMIGMIKRGDQYLLPKGNNKLISGDIILLILHRFDRDKAMNFF